MTTARARHIYLSMALALLLVLVMVHAAVPALADTWTRVNADGFNDSNNSYLLSMAKFGDYLYAGTSNWVSGAQLLRSVNGTSWSPVTTNGFGNASNIDVASMAAFNDRLYAGTRNVATGCEVWMWNGSAWAPVNTGGFGAANNDSVTSMKVFGDYLYAGVQNLGGACRLWRTHDGTSWSQVVGQSAPGTYGTGPGFGDVNNNSIISMAAFQGSLYAGTYNVVTGAEAWKSSNGTTWNKSGANGFSGAPDGNRNTQAASMAVFRDALYAGTFNANGAEMWRTTNGTSWNRVVKKGFETGDHAVQSLAVCNGALYAGTWNCQVFKSSNGDDWSKANTSGFGDSHNAETPSMAVFGDYLYAGTGNFSTGCELWRASVEPPSTPTWYLAEGTTAWGFSTYITIENPNTTEAHAAITYNTSTGDVSGGTLALPAKSQTTITNDALIAAMGGPRDFSTKITCTEGKAIAVDRTMSWTGTGAASPEGHSSIGVTSPAKAWYLPEGSSGWGFETWLLIQNPNPSPAACQVTYLIEGGAPVTKSKTVPANARASYSMEDDIGIEDASIKVTADKNVIPERSMYRDARREGHNSIGTTAAANDYYLAEGTTAWGFTTYVLMMNPNAAASDVTITYMTSSGPQAQPAFSLPGNSRKTIKVNDVPGMAGVDFSTRVSGSKPIIAERAMYWGAGTPAGEACHDSVGLASAHTTFYFPDGETSNGRETWTLVQNPNASAVNVEITYMTPAGKGNKTITDSIPANSRKTYFMGDAIPSGRAAIMVKSKTAGKKIMCERAMYWNNRGAGTDSIGGYAD